MSGWAYTSFVDATRRQNLLEDVPFDELIARVIGDITNVRPFAEPGRDPGLTDCIQPIFRFDLPKTGDLLFNGRSGYRAQYWKSPSTGLAANSAILDSIQSRLVGSIGLDATPELKKIDVCASLRAASAKLWIQEVPTMMQSPSCDLAVVRWAEAAENHVELAQWGICAPAVEKFEVKGALIDPFGNEVVPARKIGRHYDIHNYGFS